MIIIFIVIFIFIILTAKHSPIYCSISCYSYTLLLPPLFLFDFSLWIFSISRNCCCNVKGIDESWRLMFIDVVSTHYFTHAWIKREKTFNNSLACFLIKIQFRLWKFTFLKNIMKILHSFINKFKSIYWWNQTWIQYNHLKLENAKSIFHFEKFLNNIY